MDTRRNNAIAKYDGKGKNWGDTGNEDRSDDDDDHNHDDDKHDDHDDDDQNVIPVSDAPRTVHSSGIHERLDVGRNDKTVKNEVIRINKTTTIALCEAMEVLEKHLLLCCSSTGVTCRNWPASMYESSKTFR
jgi:hypothetical protein